MATILDYLTWRGDVPFTHAGVNEVDEYILCKFGMLDYTGIVPEDGAFVPARQAVEAYLRRCGEDSLGVISSRYVVPALRRAAETERFGGVMLSGWRQRISPEENEQFAALTVRLPDGRHYITFRGTDDTLVGWKEDMLMAVLDTVPAQADAARYLQWACDVYPGQLTVGGHSKGGNLAIYAAACLEAEAQERIAQVFNFDGPGFREPFFQTEGYRRIRDRVRITMPHNAMVGTLLYRDVPARIVRATTPIFGAHDGFTWETGPAGFVPCGEFSPASRAYDRAMKDVLENMTSQERAEFIEEFFGTLSATGAVTLTDITGHRLREIARTARALRQEPGVQKLVWEVLEVLEALTRGYMEERAAMLPGLEAITSLRRKRREGDTQE